MENKQNFLKLHNFVKNQENIKKTVFKIESNEFKKIYINLLKKNNKKANYFESFNKINQNNKLNKLKIKTENFKNSNIFKYLKIEKTKEILKNKIISNKNLLNLLSKAFKSFIHVLVSDIKLNDLNSNYLFKFKKLELEKIKNFTLKKKTKKIDKINLNYEKEINLTNLTNLTNLLYIEKNNKFKNIKNKVLTISLPFNFKILKKIKNNYNENNIFNDSIKRIGKLIGNEKIGFIDEKTNKGAL
jgi:hypothetical protein